MYIKRYLLSFRFNIILSSNSFDYLILKGVFNIYFIYSGLFIYADLCYTQYKR